MRQPTFTVVMPVRNGADHIERTLTAILDQGYDPLRVLLLENFSTDETVPIVTRLGDPRVEIVPAATPLSMMENWTRANAMDLDELVTFLPHDDLVYDGFFEEVARLVEADPQASLYQVQVDDIDEAGVVRGSRPRTPLRQSGEEYVANILDNAYYTQDAGMVMRSAAFKAAAGYPDIPVHAEVILACEVAAQSYAVASPLTLAAKRSRGYENARATTPFRRKWDSTQTLVEYLAHTSYGRSRREAVRSFWTESNQAEYAIEARMFATSGDVPRFRETKSVAVERSRAANLPLVRTGRVKAYELIGHLRPSALRSSVFIGLGLVASLFRRIRHVAGDLSPRGSS